MTTETMPTDLLDRVVRAEDVAWYEWTPGVETIRFSPAYAALFDLDPNEITTRTTYAFLHPDDMFAFRTAHVAFFKSPDNRLTLEFRFRSRGGAMRWARLRALADRNAAGRVTRMTGTISEITEQKQHEAENRALLARQAASVEVMKMIIASPGDPQPVFELIARHALELCGADAAVVQNYDGANINILAMAGHDAEAGARYRQTFPRPANLETMPGRAILTRRTIHIQDLTAEPGIFQAGRGLGVRAALSVPLLWDEHAIGCVSVARYEARAFDTTESALLESFAEQAMIAMENARLLTELREALERQTATAEVLQVINANPGDLGPVFDTILAKAHTICGAEMGTMFNWDGSHLRAVAMIGYPDDIAALFGQPLVASGGLPRLIAGERYSHRTVDHVPDETEPHPWGIGFLKRSGIRTNLVVPLRKDTEVLGFISANRRDVRPFSDKEIALLESFAAQAVIAMDNARLLNELRARTDELGQRQAELRVTFENMGDGVAMFDETQHLAAWNRKFQDILDVPDEIIARRQTFAEYARYLAERGEFGADTDVDEQVRGLLETTGQMRVFERMRPNGQVIEVRSNPVPGGGFVLIYSDITDRKRNEAEIAAARDAAQEATRTIEAAFRELKTAQANLVQAEKMASLGQLTAGIAHEIKNPLNFVNNFASLSVELLDELKETVAPGVALLDDNARADTEDLTATLTTNLGKIEEHGKRADGIVRSMLEHSREASGERRAVDLNTLVEEALNLAWHGARAQDQSFNITLERDFAADIAPITLAPQEMTRVLLNLISNGFYAARKRQAAGGMAFEPRLGVATRDLGDAVEIRVRDNGTGIPDDIRDKLFQPFFTTKPTGEGTGLGLSITWDIVTKQHGGTIAVASEVDAFTEFTVTLPRRMFEGAAP